MIRKFWRAMLVCALCVTAVQAQSEDPADDAVEGVIDDNPVVSNGANALDFTPGSGSCGGNNDQTIGWAFNVDAPVTVVAMAWHDDNLDGLERAHEVGIFRPDGSLIASTHVTIPAGAGAPLDGIWRIVKITPTTLPAGQGYIVGGFNGAGQASCLDFNVSQTVHPYLTYIDATFSSINGIFEIPNNFSGANNGFYGVGFQITTCTGNERIRKAKCKLRNDGSLKTIVNTEGANPGDRVTVTLDSGQQLSKFANSNGVAKFKFFGVGSGPNGATAEWDCGAEDSRVFICP